jgi:hypothetical protein
MADWANAWLELQCNMISGVTRGIVALGAPDRGPLLMQVKSFLRFLN